MGLPALKDTNLLFLDTETGGLSPREHDILSVACILTDPTGRTVLEEWEGFILPTRPVDPKAAEVNGYTKEAWEKYGVITLNAAMIKVLTMLRDAMMVCHNTPFDKAFIDAALYQTRQKWTGRYHTMCTQSMSLPLLRAGLVENVKLVTMTKYFNIPHTAHRSLGDARACREVFLCLQDIYGSAIEAHRASRSTGSAAS